MFAHEAFTVIWRRKQCSSEKLQECPALHCTQSTALIACCLVCTHCLCAPFIWLKPAANVLIQAAQVRKSSFVAHNEGHGHAYHPETHHSHTIHAGTSVQQVGASLQHTRTIRTCLIKCHGLYTAIRWIIACMISSRYLYQPVCCLHLNMHAP